MELQHIIPGKDKKLKPCDQKKQVKSLQGRVSQKRKEKKLSGEVHRRFLKTEKRGKRVVETFVEILQTLKVKEKIWNRGVDDYQGHIFIYSTK